MTTEDNPILAACRALESHGVHAVLVGGAAVVLHGSAYITEDIDFCCSRDPEQLQRLSQTLNALRPRFRVQGVPEGVPTTIDPRTLRAGDAFSFITDLGNLDVRFTVDGIGDYNKVRELSEPFRVRNLTLQLLSIDGLIQSKRFMGRPRDLLVLPELEMMREARMRHDQSGPLPSGETESRTPSSPPSPRPSM